MQLVLFGFVWGCNCIQPPGTVSTRVVITALKGARCVWHSWEWHWEEHELVLGKSLGQQAKYSHHTFMGHITSLLLAVVQLER